MQLDWLVARPERLPLAYRLEEWAHKFVPAGTGLGMQLSQEANKALRSCQIGKVTKR